MPANSCAVEATFANTACKQQNISTLYQNNHRWLSGWLYQKLNCSEQAADLAQDVFLRLLNRASVVVPKEPKAYLSSIARGLVIDHWRRNEIEQAWLASQAQLGEQFELSAEDKLQLLETLNIIDKLLSELKPKVRQAFLLAQLEGLTCPKIALRLGVSLATVERYLAKALRHCYKARFHHNV
jgi:RNA polymerase sigma-70 factor (ECF subfamily)